MLTLPNEHVNERTRSQLALPEAIAVVYKDDMDRQGHSWCLRVLNVHICHF